MLKKLVCKLLLWHGDTFGTINSGADWDLNDIYQLVLIIEEFNDEIFIGTDIIEVNRINHSIKNYGEKISKIRFY